jgi:hypothetical protein
VSSHVPFRMIRASAAEHVTRSRLQLSAVLNGGLIEPLA